MITELFAFLMTPCPPWARRLGLLTEQIAISARHKRCADDWAPHLEECRRIVLKTAHGSDASRIVILGSGAGLDVPLEALSETCQRITLVDAVHPQAIRRRAKRLDRGGIVDFVQVDLSGMADRLGRWASTLPEPCHPAWRPAEPTTLVVSLNLISQLAIPYLKRASTLDQDRQQQFKNEVMRTHLEWLKGLRCPVLLIGEQERMWHDTEGSDPVRERVLNRLDLGVPLSEWSWPTIPPGERTDGLSMTAQMGAWRF